MGLQATTPVAGPARDQPHSAQLQDARAPQGAKRMRTATGGILFAWLLAGIPSLAAAPPENLAPQATISATSHYSARYVAQLVADNQIPGPMSHADEGKAWCAQGNRHPQGVRLTFTWPAPVRVAELVYYGRTAFQWEENWKEYEVLSDPEAPAIASGQLLSGHGPQRIRLPAPVTTDTLTLVLSLIHI